MAAVLHKGRDARFVDGCWKQLRSRAYITYPAWLRFPMKIESSESKTALPSLTIVIPNYNHGHLIGEQLRAIFSQSAQAQKIVIIDDASIDDSVAAIERLIAGRKNVEFIRKSVNRGVVEVVNEAMVASETDCLYFAAADDVVLPGFLEKSLRILARYPQAALCSTASLVRSASGDSTIPDRSSAPSSAPTYLPPDRMLELLMQGEGWIMGNATIYRRQPLLSVGGFPRDLESYADGFIARALALRHGACFLPDALAVFRPSEVGYATSTSRSWTAMEKILIASNVRMKFEFRDVFPDALISRSNARFLFSSIRAAIRKIESRIRAVVAQVQPLSGSVLLPTVVRYGAGALVLALFCVLRFRDIPRVARSWLLRRT